MSPTKPELEIVVNNGTLALLADINDQQIITTDVPNNNATTLKHGFLPKLPGASEKFLNGSGEWSLPSTAAPHPYYHFHGFAGDQIVGDAVFYDKAAGNHAVPGVHLPNGSLWAKAGYASTLDPVSGAGDSVLRMPAINFDYSGGEKLIIWMLGKWTAPTDANTPMVGDGSVINSAKGWQIRAATNGKIQPVIFGATSAGYGATSTEVICDGTLKEFGIVMDGSAKKYCLWGNNGTTDANFSSYLPFSSGVDFDTKTNNTVNIGSASAAPGGTVGMATSTRACVIIRLPASYPTPAIVDITNIFRQLRANPGKLVLSSAF